MSDKLLEFPYKPDFTNKVKGGTFETSIAPNEYWSKVDPNAIGHIPVLFQGQIMIARPLFDPFTMKVPSKDFIIKHRNDIRLVVRVASDFQGCIWWEKFIYNKDSEFVKSIDDYPYSSVLYFDEEWKVISCTSSSKKYFKIENDNGDHIIIDRFGSSIELLNKTTSGKILMDKEGILIDDDGSYYKIDKTNSTIEIKNKTTGSSIVLDNTGIVTNDNTRKTIVNSNNIFLTSSTAASPAVLGDKLLTSLQDILSTLTSLVNILTTWATADAGPAASKGITGIGTVLLTQLPSITSSIANITQSIIQINSQKVKLS